jgi:hypothetical protein
MFGMSVGSNVVRDEYGNVAIACQELNHLIHSPRFSACPVLEGRFAGVERGKE